MGGTMTTAQKMGKAKETTKETMSLAAMRFARYPSKNPPLPCSLTFQYESIGEEKKGVMNKGEEDSFMNVSMLRASCIPRGTPTRGSPCSDIPNFASIPASQSALLIPWHQASQRNGRDNTYKRSNYKHESTPAFVLDVVIRPADVINPTQRHCPDIRTVKNYKLVACMVVGMHPSGKLARGNSRMTRL
jgi:hypothetical protein